MNKTNYINLNEEAENNFTTSKNNDIMKLYGRLKEISGRNKQNGWDAKTTVPNVPKIPDMWGGMDNGKSKHKRPSEHNKPHPLPYRPSEDGKPELILRPGKLSVENKPKHAIYYIPKEKKEQERLKRATGDYDLKKIDPEKIKEYLRLKEKTPDDYYSLSVPRKELDERLNKEAFGPKTDFSVWNFENNYDKLNKEEKSMLIHKMQLAFNNEGYKDNNGHPLKPDGIFGNKTKSVYEQYKKDKKDELEDSEFQKKNRTSDLRKGEELKIVPMSNTNMSVLSQKSQNVYADDIREPEDKQLDFDDQKKIDALIYSHNMTDNIEEKEAYRRAISQIRKQDKYKNIYKNSENGIYKDDYNYTSQTNLTASVNILNEGTAWLEGGKNEKNDIIMDVADFIINSDLISAFGKLEDIIKIIDYDYYKEAEKLKEGDILVTLNGAYSDSSESVNTKNFYRDKRGTLYRILSTE